MSKYDSLTEWLGKQMHDSIEVSFDDIEDEEKIGVKLPRTAKEHRAW